MSLITIPPPLRVGLCSCTVATAEICHTHIRGRGEPYHMAMVSYPIPSVITLLQRQCIAHANEEWGYERRSFGPLSPTTKWYAARTEWKTLACYVFNIIVC
jgi:hypothetical protein